MDFTLARRKMVDEQIIMRGIRDPQVLEAMYRIERHRFVPEEEWDNAYRDGPLAIGKNQTISQPYMAALMTEALLLSGEEKVLEIGTGSGYQTALLAERAKQVYTLERFPELFDKARALLGELGYTTIKFALGDGSLGWQDEAPFDRILVTAACPRVPFPLKEQLRESGIIVLPIGDSPDHQVLNKGIMTNGIIQLEPITECVFVPLVGEFWMVKAIKGKR